MLAPFIRRVRDAEARGLVDIRFRHRVDGLTVTGGAVDGVHGAVLEPTESPRGRASSRAETGEFELAAQAVIVTSGGIGGNHELVRRNWPDRLGPAPAHDGRRRAGARGRPDAGRSPQTPAATSSTADRMWHYTEGLHNWDPIWPDHGIRILPGPSSLWLDALGRRLPAPLFPGFDTLGTLGHILRTGYDYSWFVLNQRIIGQGVRAVRARSRTPT